MISGSLGRWGLTLKDVSYKAMLKFTSLNLTYYRYNHSYGMYAMHVMYVCVCMYVCMGVCLVVCKFQCVYVCVYVWFVCVCVCRIFVYVYL